MKSHCSVEIEDNDQARTVRRVKGSSRNFLFSPPFRGIVWLSLLLAGCATRPRNSASAMIVMFGYAEPRGTTCKGDVAITLKPILVTGSAGQDIPQTKTASLIGSANRTNPSPSAPTGCLTSVHFENLKPGTWDVSAAGSSRDGTNTLTCTKISLAPGQSRTKLIWEWTCQ